MPRERKPFAKFFPDFLLGRSTAGMRFAELDLDEQMIYCKWWARSIEVRRIFWETSGESLRKLAQSLGVSFRKFGRTFEKVLAKRLAEKAGENLVYLKGIKELHAGYIFRDGDKTGNDEGRDNGMDEDRNGAALETTLKEVKRYRETTTPKPPEKFGSLAPGAAGGGGSDFFDFWQNCSRAFPAIAARGVAREAVEKILAGKNGASAQWLAALAEACADGGVRAPLAVLEKRVAAGAMSKGSLRLAEAVLRPPRGQQECACGGGLQEFYCQGSGDSGRRCGQCGASYPREIFR